jgi:two-component sensor histidine kinase
MYVESQVPANGQTIDPYLLAEEITHRIANEYAAAIGSLSLVAARCPNLETKSALASAAGRLFDYAEAHRALLPPYVESPVDLGNYLRALCCAMVRARLAERNISLTLKEETIRLEAHPCWRVGMIVSELITNAARHGLRNRAGGIIVELAARDGAVECQVTDNGDWVNPKPGRGTQITRALALELGGQIEWEFGPCGTTALLRFPLGGRVSPFAA